MSSVNKVILIGHLAADPELKALDGGKAVATFRLATNERWRDKQSGEDRERTEWHGVVIFSEGLCRVAEQYLKKGSKVYLEGQLQTRKWQGQDGQDRYTTEVVLQNFNGTLVLLDRPGSGPGMGAGGMQEDDYSSYSAGNGGGIYRNNGSLNVTGSTLEANTAANGGGIFADSATAMVSDSRLMAADEAGTLASLKAHGARKCLSRRAPSIRAASPR